MKRKNIAIFALLAIAFWACQSGGNVTEEKVVIDTLTIDRHLSVLASDDFMGRKPFTEGEEKTIHYLESELKGMGLKPGNGDSYFQEVPLVEITGTQSPTMTVTGQGESMSFKTSDDVVIYTERVEEEVAIKDSELVYAGFGIVAPEYGWNDYEGMDVKGKTVVVLVNDPGFGSGDSTFFKGDQMTYYGRWTYKYEEAARQGAAGVLIVHETVPAGYPWLVVQSSWTGAKLNLDDANPPYKCAIQGWITRNTAVKLFQAAGIKDYSSLAKTKGFNPIAMGLKASMSVKNEIKRDMSHNVVAMVEGSERPDEYVIYSAHWDHLGVGAPVDGDSIYNGAHDNASGTVGLLTIAETFAKMETKPQRSVVFLFVTAEEQGLLGSAYYAQNPLFLANQSVANINIDGLPAYGEMKDLTITGYGQSELDTYAKTEADKQGRYVIPDPDPSKGYFFRSDHFNFAKIGIPALYASGSYESKEKGVEFIEKKTQEYLAIRYHQQADNYLPEEWDLKGIAQDAALLFNVGKRLANETYFPKWSEGSEFKAKRDEDMSLKKK
ncbi:M28 family metallopeptidase [Roseivirga echinicomitans]|uniref:Peptidase M28 n=1 Tax=Roseivirga echinicomitans TaxID=296218 RepID=A0A150XDE2_9BACT|nr:M28 family metallopeptidase [Roseivirga echinicomitans]KYG76694.1 peptidase M28 [Roseivirga echinicomitans]